MCPRSGTRYRWGVAAGTWDDVAGAEWIPCPARDARARVTRAVDHFAAHDQHPFTAPYEHDVEAVVMNLGNSV